MKFAKLGRTGLEVSRLGFGTWQIGGGRWKALHDDDSVALLRTAVEHGVNVFDVATVYGQYRNEMACLESHSLELLGRAFTETALQCSTFICLKVGQLDELSHLSDYSPRNIVERVRHSLALLRRELVDICLIHAPSLAEVEQGRALAVLETLKSLGMVRAIGYSFENEPLHVAAALRQSVDVLMLQYNLIDSECADVLDDASRRGVGVLVGGPYKRGYLSGRYRYLSELPLEDGYWEWNVRHCAGKVESTLRRVRELMEGAGGSRELRSRALGHVLAKPAVGSAIVGHRGPEEIGDNVGIVDALSAAV